MINIIFLVPIALLILSFLTNNIRVVPQANAYIVERLGTYSKTWSTGLHFKIPFIERVARKVNLKIGRAHV